MIMLKLTLMNHNFQIPCEEEDKALLIEAATLLEEKLDQVPSLKGESKILMVSLNLCFEYLQMKKDAYQYSLRLDEQIEEVMSQITSDSPNKPLKKELNK